MLLRVTNAPIVGLLHLNTTRLLVHDPFMMVHDHIIPTPPSSVASLLCGPLFAQEKALGPPADETTAVQ